MRHIRSVLLSLCLLTGSIGVAAAENVCVQAADGAIVCGPVAQGKNSPSPSPNPFDQPPQNYAPPAGAAPPSVAAHKPPPGRTIREAHRDTPPPRHVYRQPPSRDLDRHPPRRIAREDVRRLQAERDHRPPPRAERERPIRYSDAGRRQFERDRERMPPPRVEMANRYDARLRDLEREVRALRAERERYALPQRAPHRVARDRYSNDD
jgi:hypothetical protein